MNIAPNSPKAAFSIPHPRIISQTLEQETLVINLDVGSYYCLENSASIIWQLALLGLSVQDICIHLKSHWNDVSEDFEKQVGGLLHELVTEGVLTVMNSDEDKIPPTSDQITELFAEAKFDFSPPEFSKFTDLQELLLADPIHELIEDS
jgi:hypothetical protein